MALAGIVALSCTESVTTRRSARRQTVRATWKAAASGVPAGRMKHFNGSSVALDLQGVDMRRGDPLGGRLGRGELGAEVEEFALHPTEQGIEGGGHGMGAGHAEVAVEFVHRAEGLDPCVVLSHPRSAEQPRLAGIAGLGIDLHVSDHLLRKKLPDVY